MSVSNLSSSLSVSPCLLAEKKDRERPLGSVWNRVMNQQYLEENFIHYENTGKGIITRIALYICPETSAPNNLKNISYFCVNCKKENQAEFVKKLKAQEKNLDLVETETSYSEEGEVSFSIKKTYKELALKKTKQIFHELLNTVYDPNLFSDEHISTQIYDELKCKISSSIKDDGEYEKKEISGFTI